MRRFSCGLAIALAIPASAGIAQSSQQVLPRVGHQTSPVQRESCVAGNVFGIMAYQCANCRMTTYQDSMRIAYSFGSEPVVVETDTPTNRIKPGDFVVAVNGHPITTRTGADQFAYPPVGESVITVRRNGVNINIEQLVMSERACPTQYRRWTYNPDSAARGRVSASAVPATSGPGTPVRVGRGVGGGGGRGGRATRTPDSLTRAENDSTRGTLSRMADSARLTTAVLRSAEQAPRVVLRTFALTLTCNPVCTRARASDGTTYWRFDGYPTVSAPASASLAGRAGLREGDVLITVNGHSPLTETGALLLNRSERELTLQLEISRAGKRERIALKL